LIWHEFLCCLKFEIQIISRICGMPKCTTTLRRSAAGAGKLSCRIDLPDESSAATSAIVHAGTLSPAPSARNSAVADVRYAPPWRWVPTAGWTRGAPPQPGYACSVAGPGWDGEEERCREEEDRHARSSAARADVSSAAARDSPPHHQGRP
jgi:hypothetical protein